MCERTSHLADRIFDVQSEPAADPKSVLGSCNLVGKSICSQPLQGTFDHTGLDVRITPFIAGRITFSPTEHEPVKRFKLRLVYRWIGIAPAFAHALCHPV